MLSAQLSAYAGDSLYNKGTSLLFEKKYLQALPYFNAAIGKGTKFVAAYINRGVCYSHLGYHQKAIDDFTTVLKIEPNEESALFNRGNSLAALKRYDEALKDFNKAADVCYKARDPILAKVYFARAAINHETKQFQEAMEDCRRILAIPKAQEQLRKNADSLYKWCQLDMQREIQAGILKAAELVRARDYTGAEKELNRISRYEPHSSRILLLQSTVAVLLKDHDKAEAKAREALKADPKEAKCYLVLADVMLARSKYDEASENITRAMDNGLRSAEVYQMRAVTFLLAGRSEKAVADLNEILRLRPKDSGALLMRGVCSIISRDANQMVTDGKSVMDNELITTEKGMQGALLAYDGLLRCDRASEAASFMDDCLQKGPKDKWPYQVFQFLKKDIDGEALLKSAQNPAQQTDAHAWLGITALRGGDRDKALSELSWCKQEGDTKQLSYVLLAAALQTPKVQSPAVG